MFILLLLLSILTDADLEDKSIRWIDFSDVDFIIIMTIKQVYTVITNKKSCDNDKSFQISTNLSLFICPKIK